jgi:hypothetical protein
MSQVTIVAQSGGGGSGTVLSVTGGLNTTVTGTPTLNPVINVSGTTDHSVLLGNSTGSINSLTSGTAGQLLQANTSADPSWVTLITSGTWTPQLQFAGDSTGVTYSTQVGSYIQVANCVSYSFSLVITSPGTFTTTDIATIVGFPTSTSLFGFAGTYTVSYDLGTAGLQSGSFYIFNNEGYMGVVGENWINNDFSPDFTDSTYGTWQSFDFTSFASAVAITGSGFYFTS